MGSGHAVEQVRALYAVEREAKELARVGNANVAGREVNDRAANARLQLYCERSAPITARMREKLLAWKEQGQFTLRRDGNNVEGVLR